VNTYRKIAYGKEREERKVCQKMTHLDGNFNRQSQQ